MKTVGWLPAGAQLWNKNTWDSGGTRAAYSSTLAIYVYDVAASPPKLEKILVALLYLCRGSNHLRRGPSRLYFSTIPARKVAPERRVGLSSDAARPCEEQAACP